MKALIVGAGVGGLTAAVALQRADVEVEVFERAAEPRRILVGGGLHIWPNGMRAFTDVGIGEAVRATGETISRLDWHTPTDGLLVSADLAATARKVGAPSVGIRRADLLGVLLEATGPSSIRLGSEVTSFEQDEQGVSVEFADGGRANGDLLIAADGLQSTLRSQLAADAELRSPGVVVCQGASEGSETVAPSTLVEVWAPRLRFGCYPFRDGLNWFAFVPSSEAGALATGAHELLLDRTAGWTAPARDVIETTPAAGVSWAEVVALDPLPRWTEGRVTILGDAAHAMTPFLGQGACQAIEDGVVLAECVRDESDVAAALRRYEARRRPRAVEIWHRSWAAAASVAKKSRTIDPKRRQAFADTFERAVWAQLEQTIVQPF